MYQVSASFGGNPDPTQRTIGGQLSGKVSQGVPDTAGPNLGTRQLASGP